MSIKIKNGLALQGRAKRMISGMTGLLSKQPNQFSEGVWPGYYSRGKGVNIWDLDDNEYIDMSIGGIGATILGYADSDVDSAVHKAINLGVSSSLVCPEEVDLADLLCEIHPWADQVYYTRSGGEAIAVAIRLARALTGREKICFCGYHGWHDWYLSTNLMDVDHLNNHLFSNLDPIGIPQGLSNTVYPFTYNQLQSLEELIGEHQGQWAAIVMEPIRSEYPVEDFLLRVKKLAKGIGAVLIFDEISSGFRMNSGGAHLLLEVDPDLAIFSKAIGNGYAISAIIGIREVMSCVQKTFISSTHWTERIGPTAAIATILKHRSLGVGDHLMFIGKNIQRIWRDLSNQYGFNIEISGIPPLTRFYFKDWERHEVIKAFLVQSMLDKGFLFSNIFIAMYSHELAHINSYQKALEESLKEMAIIRDSKESLKKYLRGAESVSGFKPLKD